MTLGNLKTKIARYLQKPEAEFVSGDQDMLLEALESARIQAEQRYSWNRQRASLDVVVPPAGYDFTDDNIKTIDNAWMVKDGQTYAIQVRTQKSFATRAQRIMRSRGGAGFSRYPDDAVLNPFLSCKSSQRQLVFHGNTIKVEPALTVNTTIRLDCQTWMETYYEQDDTYEDWMLQYGHSYLFWQAVIEVNHFTKSFIPRQEGNLPPPERLAAQALEDLRNHDSSRFVHAANCSA